MDVEDISNFLKGFKKIANDNGMRLFRVRTPQFYAMQYTGDNAWDILKWMDPTYKLEDGFNYNSREGLEVKTETEIYRIHVGDWMAKEPTGFVRYSPDLFAALFEEME